MNISTYYAFKYIEREQKRRRVVINLCRDEYLDWREKRAKLIDILCEDGGNHAKAMMFASDTDFSELIDTYSNLI